MYLPADGRFPVVCLFHGGFWRAPHGRAQFTPVAEDLSALGHAVWNIGYRRIGEPGGGWTGTLDDAGRAVDHLVALVADGIPLDLDRVVLVGHSAGGQLALWAAARTSRNGTSAPVRVRPAGIAALAAVADLERAWALGLGHGAVEELLGGSPGQHPERYAAASPMKRLPLGIRQWIVHGDRDGIVPPGFSRDYAAAAAMSGDPVEFVELAGADHMDFLDPRGEAHAALRTWLADFGVAGPR